MGSAITSILDNIKTWAMYCDSSVGTTDVGVLDIDQLQDNLEPMSCPKRVLSVVSPTLEANNMMFAALGSTFSIDWQIHDTLYLKPSGETRALNRYSPQIVDYVAAYVDKIRINRTPTAQSSVESATATPGIFQWGGIGYLGVDLVLTVHEIVSGP